MDVERNDRAAVLDLPVNKIKGEGESHTRPFSKMKTILILITLIVSAFRVNTDAHLNYHKNFLLHSFKKYDAVWHYDLKIEADAVERNQRNINKDLRLNKNSVI